MYKSCLPFSQYNHICAFQDPKEMNKRELLGIKIASGLQFPIKAKQNNDTGESKFWDLGLWYWKSDDFTEITTQK